MEPLLELLMQIQELAGVAIDALTEAGVGAPEGGPPVDGPPPGEPPVDGPPLA